MTDDFFRARLDGMIDPNHALAVLAQRLPWARIEQAVAPCFARKACPEQWQADEELFGATAQVSGGGISNAGRARRPLRLMIALTLLKNSFDLSDEALVERFAENVYWQHFAGYEYFDPASPCDATQIGRFRSALGEAGMEELLKATVETAVDVGAVRKSEFECLIVDTTVQEKAIAYPVDSRLLEIARHKVATAAKTAGIGLKQTFAAEGKTLRRQAGGLRPRQAVQATAQSCETPAHDPWHPDAGGATQAVLGHEQRQRHCGTASLAGTRRAHPLPAAQ